MSEVALNRFSFWNKRKLSKIFCMLVFVLILFFRCSLFGILHFLYFMVLVYFLICLIVRKMVCILGKERKCYFCFEIL